MELNRRDFMKANAALAAAAAAGMTIPVKQVDAAEDMGIVLRKRTHTCQSVQLSTLLITVHRSEFGDSQRQVFI